MASCIQVAKKINADLSIIQVFIFHHLSIFLRAVLVYFHLKCYNPPYLSSVLPGLCVHTRYTMFNGDITSKSTVSISISIPSSSCNSATTFCKSKLIACNITPKGKSCILLRSKYGFRLKIVPTTFCPNRSNARIFVPGSNDRSRLANALSVNPNPPNQPQVSLSSIHTAQLGPSPVPKFTGLNLNR